MDLWQSFELMDTMLDRVVARRAGAAPQRLYHELLDACTGGALEAGPNATARLLSRIRALSLDDIHVLLDCLTLRFWLHNQAEKAQIIRVNQSRERTAALDRPPRESIAEAVYALKSEGRTEAEILAVLRRLDIEPTLTAHPTEARRNSILDKQKAIAEDLLAQDRDDLTPQQNRELVRHMEHLVLLLYITDHVRSQRPGVLDEVRNGLHFLRTSIWETVPRLYEDLAEALRSAYGWSGRLPIVLRYRTWIGGDADGNPNVTPEVTRQALDLLREAAIDLHLESLERLGPELSISDRRVPPSAQLMKSIADDLSAGLVNAERQKRFASESCRLKIACMIEKLRRIRDGGTDHTALQFLDDLRVLQSSLSAAGLDELAMQGELARCIVRAETFGFHLAALDLRQHSARHEVALAELFKAAGVCGEYLACDEAARIDLLQRELSTPRPLRTSDLQLSASSQAILDRLTVFADAARRDPSALGSYIVSMTHEVSDVLEVLLLMKETGLWKLQNGQVRTMMDVAPLFETIEDLQHAADLLERLFSVEVYRKHLAAREQMQEVMLGYSDSNKDGGYCMSNWMLQNAQFVIAGVCRRAGVQLRFFHGRGGTIGRGGGRANRAILASPPESRSGRIRFTEQGEVVTFRYGLPAITRRHLEQIVSAMILGTARAPNELPARSGTSEAAADSVQTERYELMNELAQRSMAVYRSLVHDADFWPWFTRVSPIEHISSLPIASRPVARGVGEVDFDNLRAIPWVFAWTQMRYTVPGWYGLGAGVEALAASRPDALDRLRQLYRSWEFFRTLIDNAQQEMARARLPAAALYADRTGDIGGFHARIVEEFERARRAVLSITEQKALLDNNPVIQSPIRFRNPATDLLNLLQVELLRRYDAAPADHRESLRLPLQRSINAIASAMQSTG